MPVLQLDQGGLGQAREFSDGPLRQPTILSEFDKPGAERGWLGASLNSSVESSDGTVPLDRSKPTTVSKSSPVTLASRACENRRKRRRARNWSPMAWTEP